MIVECIDVETPKMAAGVAAPELVCMAWSNGVEDRLMVPWEGADPYDFFEHRLRSGALLINQHIFYDLGVLCAARPHLLPLVFAGLEAGTIRCLKVREQIIRIALGEAKFIDVADDEDEEDEDGEEGESGSTKAKTRFDLAAIAKRWLGVFVQKEGTWRTSYALLKGIPLADWPTEAVEYPKKDARIPLQVWAAQEAFIARRFEGGVLPGEVETNCAAWQLHLMKIWGVRTCAEAVAKLTRELQEKVLWTTIALLMVGICRVGGTKARPKAVQTKAETQRRITAVCEAKGVKVPFTDPTKKFPKGQVKTAKKVLEDFGEPPPVADASRVRHWADGRVEIDGKLAGDASLSLLAEHNGYTKILSTYIPKYVARGVTVPITADWNVLVESWRISCANPNLTNPPRAGDVRACFKARDAQYIVVPGGSVRRMVSKRRVYVSADFDQAELRSWAEVCLKMFGFSTMAEAFKQGIDPHLKLGAQLLGISLEEMIRRYGEGDKEAEDKRQFSKEPNFGFIGGMGPTTFMLRAALKKIFMTLEEATRTRWAWMNTWPEAKMYLDYFAKHHDKPRAIKHPITGFIRGDCGYSDGANFNFQHLTAIATKQALWDLGKECYLDHSSVLFGARPIIDMHDEIFGEVDEDVSHEAAVRWGAVMKAGAEKWIKNVPTKCTAVLTRRMHKGAKPVFLDANGKQVPAENAALLGATLVPSKPVKVDGKTKWVADL